MIHIFNRRELITVLSDQQLYRLQGALSSAGIPYRTKFLSAGRYRGTPFLTQDATHPCIIYVKPSDYDRAKAAIQPAFELTRKGAV